jgi:hypothetical protein
LRQYERRRELIPIAFPHHIRAMRGSEMEQLALDIRAKAENESVLVLDPRIRAELIALMKAIVIAVYKAEKGEDDDELS